MTTLTPPYRSIYNRTIWSAGAAHGEAKAILTVLESRGFAVTDQVRERIGGRTDLEQLDTWLHRVATVTAIEELFA